MKKYPIPRDEALSILEFIARALAHGEGPSGHSVDSFRVCSKQCEMDVLGILERGNVPVSALRKLASAVLQMNYEPQRLAIVGVMYGIASRRGDEDARYSWATMVMEGLLSTHSKQLDVLQAEAATAAYSQLARKGHARAQFGMGRLVLAKVLSKTGADAADKQVQMAVDLWQRAGRNGYAEAWYELGQLYHGGQFVPQDKLRALTCFEHGSRGGSAQASHALGTIYLTRARSQADRAEMANAANSSALAARYFLQAAQKGHAASAYNMGLLYMRTSMSENEHKARQGVLPDDRSAREWFAAAASRLFLPAMMNYGAILMEGRGRDDADTPASDMEEARLVYTRAVKLCQKIEQQQQERSSSATLRGVSATVKPDHDTSATARHMMETARAALKILDKQLLSSPTGTPSSSSAAASSLEASPQRGGSSHWLSSNCTIM